MDEKLPRACLFCDFMAYNKELLEKHVKDLHPEGPPKSVTGSVLKIVSEKIRREDALLYSYFLNEGSTLSLSKKDPTSSHKPTDQRPEAKHNSNKSYSTMSTSSDRKENEYKQASILSVASSSTSSSALKPPKSNVWGTNFPVKQALTSRTLSTHVHPIEDLWTTDHFNCQSEQNISKNENWMKKLLMNMPCPTVNEGTRSFQQNVDHSNSAIKDWGRGDMRNSLCRKRKSLEETINSVKNRRENCGADVAARSLGYAKGMSKNKSVDYDIGDDDLKDSECFTSDDECQAKSIGQVAEECEPDKKEGNDQKPPQIPWTERETFGMRQQSSYALKLQTFLQNVAMYHNNMQLPDGNRLLNIQNEFLLEKFDKLKERYVPEAMSNKLKQQQSESSKTRESPVDVHPSSMCLKAKDNLVKKDCKNDAGQAMDFGFGIFPETNWQDAQMTGQKRSQQREEDAVHKCQQCTLTFSSNLCLDFHLKLCHGDDDDEKATQEQRNLLSFDYMKRYAEMNAASLKYCSEKQMDLDLRNLALGNQEDNKDIRYRSYFDGSKFPSQFLHGKFNEFGESFHHSGFFTHDVQSQTAHKSYSCDECGKTFVGRNSLLVHMRTHTGERPYKCEECDKSYGQNSLLQRHMRTHTGERPYECDKCGKTFIRSGHLHIHMRQHTGEKPFKCDECGKSFSQSCLLQRHKRTHTGEKPFECEECGKSFTRKHILQAHMRSHTGERPFKCDECGKSFSRTNGLQMHMKTHSEEKPHNCEECGKCFKWINDLRIHMRSHTGEKPFNCEECGKNFSRKNSLHVHRRTHTGEKPYKCNECGKTFIQSGELHTHRRTHTGEKPFKCDVCGRSFSQSSHLHMHKRQHTGEKPFQCGECGRSFSRSSLLLSHMRTHTKRLGLTL